MICNKCQEGEHGDCRGLAHGVCNHCIVLRQPTCDHAGTRWCECPGES